LFAGLAVIAVAFALTGFIIATTQERFLTEQLDRELRTPQPISFTAFQGGIAGSPAPPETTLSKMWVGHLDVDGTMTTLVQGQAINDQPAVSLADAAAHVGRNGREPFTVEGVNGDERFRVVMMQRPGEDGWDLLALSLRDTDAAYQRLLIATGVGTVAVLAIIVLIGAWVVRLGVRPINEMTEAADAITAGQRDRRMAAYPVGTEAGHLALAFNTMLDERQRADDRLRQFVADASHELRTPLTSIRGYADLYQQGGLQETVRLDDAMRRVSGEAERMSAIVHDLLLLTNLDRGLALSVEELDVAAVVNDVMTDARVVQPNRALTLEAPDAVLCAADRQRLHQVVAALVHNALVHTGDDVPVEVAVRREADSAIIEVVDHGPGMDEATASHAFERFYRGDASRSRHSGGSGLGLAIAQSIVDAHGGQISLSTAPGEGCRFRVVLPATPSSG
jgi:two-component system OmpR family sensor kinase